MKPQIPSNPQAIFPLVTFDGICFHVGRELFILSFFSFNSNKQIYVERLCRVLLIATLKIDDEMNRKACLARGAWLNSLYFIF